MVKSGSWWAFALALSAIACEKSTSEDNGTLAANTATAGAADLTQIRQAIEQVDAQWEAAANRGDAAATANLYADDARFMAPNSDIVQGRQNIQAAIQGLIDARVKNVDFTTVDVGASGDLAYEIGHYSLDIQPQGVAKPITDKGKYVLVVRKQPDGNWKIVADIFNTSEPAPPAKP
jgi:uncharacterized protein (TIGR02246 family)